MVIVGLTVSKFAWKKPAEKPSRLGALFAWMEKIASFIYVGVGSWISFALVSSEIVGFRACATIVVLFLACEVKRFLKYSEILKRFRYCVCDFTLFLTIFSYLSFND